MAISTYLIYTEFAKHPKQVFVFHSWVAMCPGVEPHSINRREIPFQFYLENFLESPVHAPGFDFTGKPYEVNFHRTDLRTRALRLENLMVSFQVSVACWDLSPLWGHSNIQWGGRSHPYVWGTQQTFSICAAVRCGNRRASLRYRASSEDHLSPRSSHRY